MLLFSFAVFTLGFCSYTAFSVEPEGNSSKSYLNNYEGNIGDGRRIRMTLVFSGDKVEGVYVYADELQDRWLKGVISEGNNLHLDELNAKKEKIAIFNASLGDSNPSSYDIFLPEKIVGYWQKFGDSTQYPFEISLEGSTSGTLSHRYSVAGADDDKLIHDKALRFQTAVKNRDKETVANLINFPIKVDIDGKRRTIREKKKFIALYDKIFTEKYRARILNAIPRHMFVKYTGIMLGGRGEVWFGDDGTVIALNNED
ncbi:MAG: hypothetical protein QXH80_01520 [Candidatus Nanoarchaeia archaeon]